MQPTAQQKNIRSGNGNLAIVARAGCGKTSTLLMAVDQIVAENPRAEVAICAFNKAIADEVSEKLRERGHTNWFIGTERMKRNPGDTAVNDLERAALPRCEGGLTNAYD